MQAKRLTPILRHPDGHVFRISQGIEGDEPTG